MIVLGLLLLLLAWLLHVGILWTIGIIVIVIGLILLVVGYTGGPDRRVGGRRYWF
jgi:hypothetical protein